MMVVLAVLEHVSALLIWCLCDDTVWVSECLRALQLPLHNCLQSTRRNGPHYIHRRAAKVFRFTSEPKRKQKKEEKRKKKKKRVVTLFDKCD